MWLKVRALTSKAVDWVEHGGTEELRIGVGVQGPVWAEILLDDPTLPVCRLIREFKWLTPVPSLYLLECFESSQSFMVGDLLTVRHLRICNRSSALARTAKGNSGAMAGRSPGVQHYSTQVRAEPSMFRRSERGQTEQNSRPNVCCLSGKCARPGSRRRET